MHSTLTLQRLRGLIVILAWLAAAAAPAGAAGAAQANSPAAAKLYTWVKTWGGQAANVEAKNIKVDGSGNLYVAGEFNGTVDFDPAHAHANAIVASHNGTVDAYLSKFAADGTFLWVRAWGGGPAGGTGPVGRDAANGLAVDAQGNAYVSGLYQTTVDFGAGNVATSNAPVGSNNIFVAKFAANGTTQWARTWGGASGGESYSVAVDKWGNVYVQGDWSTAGTSPVDFNPRGPAHDWHTNGGFFDTFLSKYDTNGNFLWAKTWGAEGYDDGPGVAVDDVGGVYVAGMYGSQNINFDPAGGNGGLGHPATKTASAWLYVDVFLSKFDSNGNFQWVRTWGGLNAGGLGTVNAGESVTVDGAGNVVVSGRFGCDTCNFNAGPTAQTNPDFHSSHGDMDAFISKYDANGNFLWAKTWGGIGWDAAGSVAVDGADNIYAGGFVSATVDFGGGPVVSKGGLDAAVTTFAADGTFQWAAAWGGTGTDGTFGLAVDEAGSAYAAGWFAQTVDFDPGTGTDSRTAAGIGGGFISKFAPAAPSMTLSARPGNQTIYLDWTVTGDLPAHTTWTITYTGGSSSQASPIAGLAGSTRAYTLTGATNGVSYDITVTAVVDGSAVAGNTKQATPVNYFVYMPLVIR